MSNLLIKKYPIISPNFSEHSRSNNKGGLPAAFIRYYPAKAGLDQRAAVFTTLRTLVLSPVLHRTKYTPGETLGNSMR